MFQTDGYSILEYNADLSQNEQIFHFQQQAGVQHTNVFKQKLDIS